MDKTRNILGAVSVGVALGALVMLFAFWLVGVNQSVTPFGGSTDDFFNANGGFQVDNSEVIDGDGDLKIGSTSASSINRINAGVCHLWVGTSTVQTIAATSSKAVDCQSTNGLASFSAVMTALTGVTTNDSIFVSAPTTTPTSIGAGIDVIAVGASSTPGYITLIIRNLTGATFTFGTTSANSWHYWVADDN